MALTNTILFNELWLRWMVAHDDFHQLPQEFQTAERLELLRSTRKFVHTRELRLGYLDRTGAVEPYLPTKVIYDLPRDVEGFKKTFEQCCLERAKQLIETQEPLQVFYSGGIDSTVVVAALVKAGVQGSQMRIRMTWNSVMENPVFYRDVLRQFPCDVTSDADITYGIDLDDRHELIVNGSPGDALFAPMIRNHNDIVAQERPWQETCGPEEIAYYAPIMAAAPVPIITRRQFETFTGMNLRYQRINLRYFQVRRRGKLRKGFLDHVVNFFNTDDFQKWSMVMQDQEDERRVGQERWTAKKFIDSVAHDERYLMTKKKAVSFQILNNTTWRFLLEDGTLLHQDDLIAQT